MNKTIKIKAPKGAAIFIEKTLADKRGRKKEIKDRIRDAQLTKSE